MIVAAPVEELALALGVKTRCFAAKDYPLRYAEGSLRRSV